jgi:hypothetical protein
MPNRRKDIDNGPPCPRCRTEMKDVVTIAPSAGDPGLIAYECPKCGYVTSELYYPQRNGAH